MKLKLMNSQTYLRIHLSICLDEQDSLIFILKQVLFLVIYISIIAVIFQFTYNGYA